MFEAGRSCFSTGPFRDYNLRKSSDGERDSETASFIHIADKNNEHAILRNGIKSTKRRSGVRGVRAIPVIPNFTTTHQWARELKRRPIRAC
jgi:hypothetical protein